MSRAEKLLNGVHRVVFLGDSITQGGDYVTDIECWFLARGFKIEVLNLGLGSETASDLTEEENAGHLATFGFGRPFVSERLQRALTATKPDLLFACYGMNDGGSLPANADGTKRFGDAITRLREAAMQTGVKRVVICTPPLHDAKGDVRQKSHDENLERYTAWLLGKRADGWDVVDIHTPMRRTLDEARAKEPAFAFAGDGVHPGREGHWLMAREILTQFFGAKMESASSAADLLPNNGAEIRKLVNQRMKLLAAAWMTQIGHKRPGVAGGPGAKPGLAIAEATAKAAAISEQIGAAANSGSVLGQAGDGWRALFNGKDLSGWSVKCQPKDEGKNFWRVDGGSILCDSIGRKDHNYVWLYSDDEFGDFELRLKFQAYRDSPGNSGLQFRSRFDEGVAGGWLHGPQVDIHPPAAMSWRTGLIYDETREERRWIYPSRKDSSMDPALKPGKYVFKYEGDGWNELVLRCDGMRVKTVLNGIVRADWDATGVLDSEAHQQHQVGRKGHLALQLHVGDELKIRFKDILIREK